MFRDLFDNQPTIGQRHWQKAYQIRRIIGDNRRNACRVAENIGGQGRGFGAGMMDNLSKSADGLEANLSDTITQFKQQVGGGYAPRV